MGGESAAGPHVTGRPNDPHGAITPGRPVRPAAGCAGGGRGVYYEGSVPCVWGSTPGRAVLWSGRRCVKRTQTPQPPAHLHTLGSQNHLWVGKSERSSDREPPPRCTLFSRVCVCGGIRWPTPKATKRSTRMVSGCPRLAAFPAWWPSPPGDLPRLVTVPAWWLQSSQCGADPVEQVRGDTLPAKASNLPILHPDKVTTLFPK